MGKVPSLGINEVKRWRVFTVSSLNFGLNLNMVLEFSICMFNPAHYFYDKSKLLLVFSVKVKQI